MVHKEKVSFSSRKVTKDIIMYEMARKAQAVPRWPKSLPAY